MFFCPFSLWTITVWEKFFSKSVCVPKKIKCKVWNDMEFQLLLASILWTTEVSGKLNLLLCSAEQHEGEIFGWTVPLTQSNMHMHTEATELFMFFSWCVWAGVKTGMRQERGNLTSKCPHPDLLLSDLSSCTWAEEEWKDDERVLFWNKRDLIITVLYAQNGNPFLRVLRKILIIQLMSFNIITFGEKSSKKK